MGACLSWFTTRGKTPDAVLREFGLKNVGNKGYRDTPFSGGALPSGWFLVTHGRHAFTNDEVRRLSRDCEVVAGFVETHVMVSQVEGWKNGEQIWAVTYNAEENGQLEVDGQPPAGFAAIRDRLVNLQESDREADYIFDIPIALAKEITGYHYDESPGFTFDNFVKLSFFRRLFGNHSSLV
jgi:hypothetical protein